MENSPRSHIVYIWTLDIHVAKVLLFGKNVEKIHQKNFVSLCILRITVILLLYLGHPTSFSLRQAVTERCRLSWLTNSALVYEPKCGGEGGGGSQFKQKGCQ